VARRFVNWARNVTSRPIGGLIAARPIAGMIATGTDGSSLVYSNLASLVEGLRLVDDPGGRVVWGEPHGPGGSHPGWGSPSESLLARCAGPT